MPPTFAGVEEPGMALLRARAAKAAALPPAERDADTADCAAQRDPRDVARGLALALKWVALSTCMEAEYHYQGFIRTLVVHCQPLLSGDAAEPPSGSLTVNSTHMTSSAALDRLACCPGLWEDASLLTLLKAAIAGYLRSNMSRAPVSAAFRLAGTVCKAATRQLQDPGRAAAYAAGLASLQPCEPAERRLTVPEVVRILAQGQAVAGLRVLCSFSAVEDAAALGECARILGVRLAVLGPLYAALHGVALAAARRQVQLAQQHPRFHFEAAQALWRAPGSPLAGDRGMVHLRLALQLAEALPGRPYWLCRAAFELRIRLAQCVAEGCGCLEARQAPPAEASY
ncbi:hypothetical protein ABPG75_007554 [Micractinium tetrahymenae]